VLRNAGQALHQGLINAHNGNQFTALHLAALHGQRRVVQLLLRERAEVDSANAKGETPLHVSSKNGHAQVVCALLASGAAANQVDNAGYTALHHCCFTSGGKDVADALMEMKAEVNLQDENQNTPLHLACTTGNHLTVDTLLKYKADVTLRNKDGHVAFVVATKAGHDTILERLQPVRQNLLTRMKEINSAEQFHEARLFVKDYGLQRLKHEMVAPGFVDKNTYRLTNEGALINVFARAGAGMMGLGNPEDNAALARAGNDYAARFKVWRNRPVATLKTTRRSRVRAKTTRRVSRCGATGR